MKYITYFIKFFYRIRFWLIIAPLLVSSLIYWKTRDTPRDYTVNCSIYTGIITGVNILSESGITTTSYTQGSMMDNLLNIITADQTLKQVALRLYARIMIHGDPEEDNIYVKARNYRYLYKHGASIHHLIDKTSDNDSINEQRTYENLCQYDINTPVNYVNGIYQWNLPYVNRNALKKISVKRLGISDVLEIYYTANDPGIAYQTILILINEFNKQYQELRFGETNNVIGYFQNALNDIGKELRDSEDSLTHYRIEKQVINYLEETKHVAALSRDFELQYWESANAYHSADSIKQELEKRMNIYTEITKHNSRFVLLTNRISEINEKLAMAKYYPKEMVSQKTLDSLQQELNKSEIALTETVHEIGYLQYSKEGISNENIIGEWLGQIISLKKAEAELTVLENRGMLMAQKYVHFAPIGSTLTRKERSVNINERRYLAILDALNTALLKQKSIQMNSASLKLMNAPYYPLVPSAIGKHKLLTFAAYFAALLFTIFFFLIIDLLDHTLHTVFKAELLTGCRVIGAFTRHLPLVSKKNNRIYIARSAQSLCNSIITYFTPNQCHVINLISNEPEEGKSFIMQQIAQCFTEQGFDVTQQIATSTTKEEKRGTNEGNKIIIVKHPSLKDSALTTHALQDATLNLQIINSRRAWKNTDQKLFERTKEISRTTPLFVVLNYTKRDTAEEINGLMPPYTFLRKLLYKLSQLGLTAIDTTTPHAKDKPENNAQK